jgi:hypothetical protein
MCSVCRDNLFGTDKQSGCPGAGGVCTFAKAQ